MLFGELMRTLINMLVVAFVVLVVAAPAEAQRRRAARGRVPDAGMAAVGGSIGLTVPKSDFLDKGLGIAGNVEGYLTPRVSVRGQVGTAWWDIVGLRYNGSMQPVYFLANVVYNWEGGKWHPYVTAGGGAYRYSFEEAGLKGSTTNGGIDLGGGVEYFLHLHTTITGEVLYHGVGDVRSNRAVFKGSFWSLMIGAKQYF